MPQHSHLTFEELAEKLNAFDDQRNWRNLNPADLAKSIMIEGAELLEHFQWDETLQAKNNPLPTKNTEEIGNEVADILVYLMKFCREMNIDIVDATLKKIAKVEKKYPPISSEHTNPQNLNHEEYLRIKQSYRQNKQK